MTITPCRCGVRALSMASGQVNNLLVPENARADRYDQHVVKVDQVLNDSHRFFVRFAATSAPRSTTTRRSRPRPPRGTSTDA